MNVYMRFEIMLVCWSVGPSDEVLSTAYPPLIHPINRVWSVGFEEQIKKYMQPISNKIALESKLSRDFLANVHFLLYLCAQIALLCAMMNHIEQF